MYLLARYIFEIDKFFGAFLHGPGKFYGFAADLPEKPFALGAILQIEIAEIEERLELLPVLQRIVVVLAKVFGIDVLVEIHHFPDDFGIHLGRTDLGAAQSGIQRPDHIRDENSMMRRDGATALRHDRRRRNVFGLADFVDGINDIVGELLHAVVDAAIRCRAAAVVIDAQPAADIEIFYRESHFVDFGIDTRGFFDGVLDPADIGNLRSDVEVQHFELARQILVGSQLQAIQQLDGVDAEF